MMLDLSKKAASCLKKLPPKMVKQLTGKIFELCDNAGPVDAKHMSGHPGYKRVDQGEYRIIYSASDTVVKIAAIGKRNDDEVYRAFERKNV